MNAIEIKKEINDSKLVIAKAIASTFSELTLQSESSILQEILPKINNVKVEVLEHPNNAKFHNNYTAKLDSLIKEIQSLSKIDLSFLLNPDMAIAKRIKLYTTPSKEAKDLFKKYINQANFLNKQLGYDAVDFYNLYQDLGKENFLKLMALIKKLANAYRNYGIKFACANFDKYLRNQESINIAEKLRKKYGINSMSDLMDIYSKCASSLIKSNSLSSKEERIIRQNKREIKEKFGFKSDFEIKSFMHKLEKILNDADVKIVINTPGVKNIIDQYGLDNLSLYDILDIYNAEEQLFNPSIMGVTARSFVFLRKELESYPEVMQNNSIVHEFIHTLENRDNKQVDFCMSKYWPVNEMLTEYISRKAIKKLERNIVSICDNEAETKLGYPLFDPVVERLENTWIFKELLEAKITNDFTKVLKDIGKDGLHELSRCLVDFSAKPFRLEKLETLIENLNKRKDARSR